MRRWLARIAGLFTGGSGDARIREEIEEHLRLLAEEFEARGMSPAEAQMAARRHFGGAAATAETWRETRALPWLETLAKDVQYAVRQLRRNPGFAAAAVLTLALGIGANTAIFRVLDAVAMRSLAVRAPERLAVLAAFHDNQPASINYPVYREMAARQTAVEGLLAVADFPVRDNAFTGRLVSGNYFRLLGVSARLGRTLTDEDDRPSSPPAAVISHAYWEAAYGSSPDVCGRPLRVNNAVVTIVGVAPRGFFGERVGASPDVYLPMSSAPQVWVDFLDSPAFSVLSVMARLRPDVPVQTAEASLDVAFGQLRNLQVRQRDVRDEYHVKLLPGRQGFRDLQSRFTTPLAVLMSIVGLVLLLACSNLANLLLARSAARTHEIGVRLALGAGRRRLIGQLLTESVLLAGMGAVLGLGLAMWGSKWLVEHAWSGQPWRLYMDEGWRVLGFTAGVAILAVCLFGLAPAVAATRLEIHSALQAARPRGLTSGRRLRSTLIVAQVSVSLVLLAAASLFVRSLWNLAHQDFGFQQENVLLVRVPFDMAGAAGRQAPLYAPIFERVNSIPGVRSAALCGLGPFADFVHTGTVTLPGRQARERDMARFVSVSARYFETMGIRIVAGRGIEANDRQGGPKVAVISETAARQWFGTADAVGQVFSKASALDPQNAIEVVGVAHDLRFSDPRDPFGVVVYQPLAQAPVPLSSVVLRTEGNPGAAIGPARQAMREAAASLKIGEVTPLSEMVRSQLRQERTMALLSSAFGMLALILASVGLYGVVAYAVERRTQEVGIRLALGASRAQVSGLLMRELAGVLAAGTVLGAACVFALARFVSSMLFGLSGRDPAMLGAAALLLFAVAGVAGYLASRRAARMDPVRALRQE